MHATVPTQLWSYIHVPLVLAAVKQDGRALQHASAKMKNDRDVVLATVTQNGDALECATRRPGCGTTGTWCCRR